MVKRPDYRRIENESYDEPATDIHETEKPTVCHSGGGCVAASRIDSHRPRSSRCDWSSRA
jgi:hypothetical protein